MKSKRTPKLKRPGQFAGAHGSASGGDDDLPREELLRRYRNQMDYIGSYSKALDGIPEIRCIPGASIEGCRCPDDIRRIVETLVAHCSTTWEDGWQGRAKTPNDKLSDAKAHD